MSALITTDDVVKDIYACKTCDEIKTVIEVLDAAFRSQTHDGQVVVDWPRISSAVGKQQSIIKMGF